MRNVTAIAALILLWAAIPALPQDTIERIDPSGYLYGTVETRSGNSYTGRLRWGREESFWDDLFNSSKQDLPHVSRHHREDRGRKQINIFGVTISYRSSHESGGRQFIARFGDIREIEVQRGDDAVVTMKNGSQHRVEGASNDIGARITVQDESLGEVRLEWKNISRISFSPTPASLDPEDFRLYGRVITEDETFEGFIQWDLQECLSIDELDGETEDGDVSIQMGKVKVIEKHDRDGSYVELKDGRRLLLEDTNDVDHSLRGIFVEDERFGRVEIPWEVFQRVELEEPTSSGRGYGAYQPDAALRGTVTDEEGNTHSGKIVFDLDESEGWEMLNGERGDVEYHIPFERIQSIEPRSDDESLVTLRNGMKLTLEDGQDVSDSNDGLVVLTENDEEGTYIAWRDIRKIQFD